MVVKYKKDSKLVSTTKSAEIIANSGLKSIIDKIKNKFNVIHNKTNKSLDVYVDENKFSEITITDDYIELDLTNKDISKDKNGSLVSYTALENMVNKLFLEFELTEKKLDIASVRSTYESEGIEIIPDDTDDEYIKYAKVSLNSDDLTTLYNKYGIAKTVEEKQTDIEEESITPIEESPTEEDNNEEKKEENSKEEVVPLSNLDGPIENPETGNLISYILLIIGAFIGYKLFKTSKKNSKLRRI